MPTVMNPLADAVVRGCRSARGYGEMLVKDIPADQFAHMPHPTMNHPAFCIGHLSIYPDFVLGLIDRPELVAEKAGFEELFKQNVACVEQDGRYPAKSVIVDHYLDRYAVVTDAIAETSEEIFARETPFEGRFKEMCPTVGVTVNFMLTAHQMFHLGQLSAWRRAVNLPGVM